MNFELENKTAIVTGAAQGLGKAIAMKLSAEGANVVISDIQAESIEALAEQIQTSGQKALAVKTDVSCNTDLDALVNKSIETFGNVDILVNNAGICPRTDFEKITEQEWDRVMTVNLKSVFLLSQKVLPYMKCNKYGKIINIASGAGKIGGMHVGAHYSASKAGVICLTKTMAMVGAKSGINVNAVCPGVIDTEITKSIPTETKQKYKQMIPLGRIGSCEDVANLVAFLASELSSYITGEIADVNGGFIMD